MSLNITAHHYNVDSSPPSSAHIIETARKLVDAATSTSSRWHFIPMPSAAIHSPTISSNSFCFVWARELPSISATPGGEHELDDWDAPMEDCMNVIDLMSLPDFEGTDFRGIVSYPKSRFTNRIPRSDSTSHGRRNMSNDVDVNSDARLRKRDFPQCESNVSVSATISISKLIPFPHYHESPDPARPPPPGIDKIPAFRVATSLSPSASLREPFARTAWLVPLRGVPPVEGASAAELDDILTYERLPQHESLPRAIHWTPAAVTQFWNFLLRQRNTNNFGPIALAYLFFPPTIQRDHRENPKAIRSNKFGEGDAVRTKKGTKRLKQNSKQAAEVEARDETATMRICEYIKIYHDSQYAMKLRSLLDSFRWEDDTEGIRRTTSNALPPQRRVLKATRLVLVDETGDAILLA